MELRLAQLECRVRCLTNVGEDETNPGNRLWHRRARIEPETSKDMHRYTAGHQSCSNRGSNRSTLTQPFLITTQGADRPIISPLTTPMHPLNTISLPFLLLHFLSPIVSFEHHLPGHLCGPLVGRQDGRPPGSSRGVLECGVTVGGDGVQQPGVQHGGQGRGIISLGQAVDQSGRGVQLQLQGLRH